MNWKDKRTSNKLNNITTIKVTNKNIKKEPHQPMVVVALFVILGLYAGWQIDLTPTTTIGCTIIVASAYYLHRKTWLLATLLLLFGATTTTTWRGKVGEIPTDQTELSIKIVGRNRAYIESYRDKNGGWQDARIMLYYGTDSTLNLTPGDRLTSIGKIRDFKGGKYISLKQSNSTLSSHEPQWGRQINDMACAKIERLNLTPNAESLTKSMLLGRRETMSPDLLESYTKSGLSHLLALSGLHLGIIYLLLTNLLRPLNILPYGHITRYILVIMLLWFYAIVVGMGESILRAAIMLTFVRLSHLLHRPSSSVSSLLTSVMLMSLFNPSILYSVGFWLSVLSVFSIVMYGTHITMYLRTRITKMNLGVINSFILESIFSTIIISTLCTLTLLPLLIYTFGYISFSALLLSPLYLLTTYLLLLLALLWLLLGCDYLSGIFAPLLDSLHFTQQSLLPAAPSLHRFTLAPWELFTLYALFFSIPIFSHVAQLRNDFSPAISKIK